MTISFLSLQESVNAVSTKLTTQMSVSNVQVADSNNAVTTDVATTKSGRLLVNGTEFGPGGAMVYFSNKGVTEDVSAPAWYVSNTQLCIEYVPDMGKTQKEMKLVVAGGGGFAVSSNNFTYDGTYSYTSDGVYAWNGNAFTYDVSSALSGTSGNVTFTTYSQDGVTLAANGEITGNIVLANSNTTSTIVNTTIYDGTKKIRLAADIPVTTIGSDYELHTPGYNNPGDVIFNIGDETSTLYTYTTMDWMPSSFSPSFGINLPTGSLAGKKVTSVAHLGDNHFATTSDGHIHAIGTQLSTDYNLGLPFGIEYSLKTWTDLTEEYNFPSDCVSVSNTHGQYVLITQRGEIYVWALCYYSNSNPPYNFTLYGMYPKKIKSVGDYPSQTYYSELSKLSQPIPGKVLGFFSATNHMRVAWTSEAVYLSGPTSQKSYSGVSTAVYHAFNTYYYYHFYKIVDDGYNSGTYVPSINGKTIKQCVVSFYNYSTYLFILCGDGTIHSRYTRYYNTGSSGNLDSYNANFDPYMANSGTNAYYIQRNANSALSGRTFTKIGAGYRTFVALDTNGNLVTWGYGGNGEAGVNSTTGSYATVINANGSLGGVAVADFYCNYSTLFIKDVQGRLHYCGYTPPLLETTVGTSGNKLVPTLIPL